VRRSLQLHLRLRSKGKAGFTLIELLTVVLIISILAVMLYPALSTMTSRAEKVKCMSNLRTLYYGANCYVQQNGYWPQVNPRLIQSKSADYARAWQTALSPFGISQVSWICPTVQRQLHNPDYTQPNNVRIDYLATPFDTKRMTPYLWPTQPWFLERGDVHGHGNLMIFTSGNIVELDDIKKGIPSH
jgi:prepilin-type N-terminal cleavage/methylation domain-containing protein